MLLLLLACSCLCDCWTTFRNTRLQAKKDYILRCASYIVVVYLDAFIDYLGTVDDDVSGAIWKHPCRFLFNDYY